MKPDDIYRLRLVSDPRLSPDASRVAFTVTHADEESNDYRSAIWIVPADGSEEPRRFTWSGKRDASPRWSPDGRYLAFVSNRDGDATQAYAAPLDGGEARKLTDVPEGASSLTWSPDGAHIAFVSSVRGPAYDEEDETKRPPREITRLRYKADGRGFTHDRFMHVFAVPADASAEPRQLTDGNFDHTDPAWSPDGRSLVVCANRDPDERTRFVDLHLVDLASGSIARLTKSDAVYMKPSWSPDGKWIAARLFHDIDTAPWNSQVAIASPADGRTQILTADLEMQCGPYGHPREPIWRGRNLLFPVDSSGNTHLYSIDVPDGKPEPLIEGDLTVSDNDAVGDVIVHAVSTPVRPAELFKGDLRLTRFTDEFTESVQLVRPERFVANSADGSEVEAWIMPPAGAKAGERYPALLFVHGGPFAQYGNVFFDEFQIACAAGYAVIYSNPRGSSGYGDDWGRAIRGPISGGPGWGTVDYEDLMAVVDGAIERFAFVDPERFGVLGGSYGGFMTAWIVGHIDRFKAACAERGVYNVMSSVGTSDELWSSGSVWGGDPYEHEEAMRAASPITYAEQMSTPLLLIHSDQDHRCPIEQAEQLFTRLRLLGRDVKLIRFPHGTHDLSRGGPPRQRVYRFEAILEWFGGYLRTGTSQPA
jgi:dipeptidyl aminopeptidase/acylaminoacyl peptidase